MFGEYPLILRIQHYKDMALTLKNFATTLPPDLITLAKKNTVRECDETEKGHFEAYVDDGSESFDVSLTLRAGNEIIKHACECNSTGSICRHRVALITHIAKGTKVKEAVKVAKKENKVDLLLDDIDPNALKEWVKGLIAKNKDIELSFVHYFSAKGQLAPDEVIKIVNDAVKAIAGNKKSVDPTQLKKLVEIWSQMLAPVIEHYRANVTDEKSFINFHTLLETCIAFQFRVDSNSNKVSKFIDETLNKSVEPVSNLQVEEGWDKAISYFINHVPDRINNVRMHYLIHLQNIISISSQERQIKIIDLLAKQFEKSKPETLLDGKAYCKFIFEIVERHGLFAEYYGLFRPIHFDNVYNQKLISLLIENNYLAIAKKYCDAQIEYNFKEEYNIPYLNFLKEIYMIQKDDEALAKVRAVLFPFTFDFDDYLFISSKLPEEERKKWRTKMLTRARNASNGRNMPAMEFCFKLADAEKNYRKMIDYIDSYTPYGIILKYFDGMALTDKDNLLFTLLRKDDGYGWGLPYENEEEEKAHFSELFNLLKRYYRTDYLKMVIGNADKERRYFRLNKFIAYVKQELSMMHIVK